MNDNNEMINTKRYNLYVLHNTSKLGNEYYRLFFELGYKHHTVTFDKQWISELLRIPVWDLDKKFPLSDKPYEVAYLNVGDER